MDKLLLTPEEAAEVLSIGRTKVCALIADGDLMSVRIGKSRRLPRDAINEYVTRLEEEARVEMQERTPWLVAR